MKKKNYLMLDDEFLLYCKLNNIEDVDKLAKEIFNRGFTLIKYGETPIKITAPEPKIIEKVVEKIKEVPIEKIVEKIKEVPVEKIVEKVKEIQVQVPVEKIVERIREVPAEKHYEKVIIEKYKDLPSQGNERTKPRVPRERGDDHLYDE